MTAERLKPSVGGEKKNAEDSVDRRKIRMSPSTFIALGIHSFLLQIYVAGGIPLDVVGDSRHGHLRNGHFGLPAVRKFGRDD